MAPIKDQAIDYSHLSDEELRSRLENFGISVGPIIIATRSTYERRLYKLETGAQSPPTNHYEPVDDDEVQLRFPPEMTSSHSPLTSHPDPSFSHVREDMTSTSRVESRGGLNVARERKAIPRSTLGSRPPAEKKTSPPENKGIPFVVKLIAVLAVVLLAYLIYSNMEQNIGSSIPGGPRRVEV